MNKTKKTLKQEIFDILEIEMSNCDPEGQKDLRQKLYKVMEAGEKAIKDKDSGEPEKVQHIEVTTNDFKEIDFITYDATGNEVHLILCLNETTGDLYIIDALCNRKIIFGGDQLFAFADTFHHIMLHMKKLGEKKILVNKS